MSGFQAILPILSAVNSGIGLIGSQQQASRQNSYQQALYAQQQAQAQAQAQAQMAQLQASYDNESERRKRQLKVELASRKAAFGASGLETASSGSANAVLKGLVTQSSSEQAADDKAYGLRANAIGQSLDFANQRNLLEQSRQFSGSSNGLGLVTQGIGLAGGLLKSLL